MKPLQKICLLVICIIGFAKVQAQTEVTYFTSMGNFKIVLTDTLTPRTVDSFKARVGEKFYDGLIFHRVINNFMIQGGDPLGNGSGGPGYTIPDEFDTTLKNIPGALAMANAGPNTNGCQFYINLVTNVHLNNHYTVFGMVTSGFNVVQSIGLVPTNANDKPLTNVVIDSIRITKFAAGIQHVANSIVVPIYPNPGRGVFHIELPAKTSKLEIVNLQGQVMYSDKALGAIEVDLRDLPTGLYMVRVSNEQGVGTGKLVVN